MGCWDELCLICGLIEGGGPNTLFRDLKTTLDSIMESLSEQSLDLNLDENDLREEIRKVLLLFEEKNDYHSEYTVYEEAILKGSLSSVHYFPLKSEEWEGWAPIVVGCFDESRDESNLASGHDINTRLVSCSTGYGGSFEKVDGQDGTVFTDADTYSYNFFCLRAPYFYLQSWINRDSLPPRRITFPLEPDMSFEGEFYQIVNDDPERRELGVGTLEFIDYEGIDNTLVQFQTFFSDAFSGAWKLGEALKSGLRGNDLIPALLRDFNVWQTCPPDRWIKADPSGSHLVSPQAPNPATSAGHWEGLPTEVVLDILLDLSLSEVLSFTSTCRYFRYRFGNSDFLSLLLRTQSRLPLSPTHWFLPVPTMKGEVDKFCAACNESKLAENGATVSKSSQDSVIFGVNFPLFEFFRYNYGTDSMKNRRRLWRISLQFREEWYKYRMGYPGKFELGWGALPIPRLKRGPGV